MKVLNDIRDMLYEELEQIAGSGRMSPGSAEHTKNVLKSIKASYEIEMFEEGDFSRAEGDISRGYSHDGGYSNRGYSRDGGYSNADGYSRRRGHMVRAHYSRDDVKSHMANKLDELMETAETDEQREAIRKCKNQLTM